MRENNSDQYVTDKYIKHDVRRMYNIKIRLLTTLFHLQQNYE